MKVEIVTRHAIANNMRQKSIFKLFQLEDRVINKESDVLSIREHRIDYKDVQKRLEIERQHSLNFIKECIELVPTFETKQ